MNETDFPTLFEKTPPSSRHQIALKPDEVLFHQGDKTIGLFFVSAGRIELVRHHASGDAIVIHNAKQGEIFAESSLFSESYHCDAWSKEPSKVIRFDKDAILKALASDTDFAFLFTKNLASQIQSYRRRLELLTVKDATERIFLAILDGWQTGTVIELANEIGLSHETVYRALSKLTKEGKIRKTARGRYAPSLAL